MQSAWWIYDEEDEREPGWQLWEARGAFAAPPVKLSDPSGVYVLGSRRGRYAAWMCDAGRGSLHALEREGAWGKSNLRLLGPLPPLPPLMGRSEWIVGPSEMAREIEVVLGQDAQSGADAIGAARRAASAPRRWGTDGPAPDWAASMAAWRAEMAPWRDEAMAQGGASGALSLSLACRRAFLRLLAGGCESPSEAWAEANAGCLASNWGERAAEMGALMQRAELLALGANQSPPEVKAKRL